MNPAHDYHSGGAEEADIDRSLENIMQESENAEGDRSDELCRDFQRGHCPRGEGCWFQHVQRESGWDVELSAPGVIASLSGRQVCRDYLRGNCRRGTNCPFYHISGGERCRDYERLGDCRRGLMCPFLHVVVPGQTPPIRTPDSTPLYDRRVSFDPMGRPVQYVGAIPDTGRGLTVKTELCRDWSRFNGDCPRGTSCQYLHGHPGDTCRDFQRRGRCWRGDVCPFSHNVTPMQGSNQRATCMRFLKGECNRGQNCHYYHPDGTEDAGSSSGDREVCRKYMRGECTRGESCNYFHPHVQARFKDESEYDHGDY